MRELPPLGASDRDRDFAINQLIRGRSNAVGEVTLTANAATTTITGPNINADAECFLMPKTANAAAEFGNGTIRISAIVAGTVTITHANNAQTDRTFGYLVIGG